MFTWGSCRPDIGYAITLISKCGSNLASVFHYQCLKSIARYLKTTKKWGIKFHQKGIQKDFPNTPAPEIPNTNHDLPQNPTDTTDAKLVCFVDAAYGNNPTKRCSTTRYALTQCVGAIYILYINRRHNPYITALSSMEAELIAKVMTAKNIKHVRSV